MVPFEGTDADIFRIDSHDSDASGGSGRRSPNFIDDLFTGFKREFSLHVHVVHVYAGLALAL